MDDIFTNVVDLLLFILFEMFSILGGQYQGLKNRFVLDGMSGSPTLYQYWYEVNIMYIIIIID